MGEFTLVVFSVEFCISGKETIGSNEFSYFDSVGGVITKLSVVTSLPSVLQLS